MAYPTTLDDFTNPAGTDTLNSPSHSTQHSDLNNAVEALEAKVGIDSSAITTSLDYLVKNASSSNPGHKHTLANGATDVTATKDELNIMDGVTSTTAELNKVDGFTGTYEDLNYAKDLRATGVTDTEFDALDGINDAWTAYTPTISGAVSSIGNATIDFRYKKLGKQVRIMGSVTFGNTTSFTAGNFTFSFPVTGNVIAGAPLGMVYLQDTGVSSHIGFIQASGNTSFYLIIENVSATYPTNSIVSNTLPHTWADTDQIIVNLVYEAA